MVVVEDEVDEVAGMVVVLVVVVFLEVSLSL